VHDEQGNLLPNVQIAIASKADIVYNSTIAGTFTIPDSLQNDIVIFSADGFETLKMAVETGKYSTIVMKGLAANESVSKKHLLSLTKDQDKEYRLYYMNNEESYNSTVENKFINAGRYPETGFALNIDRASYSNIRRFLNNTEIVPPDAVRIEEMLNYFDLNNNAQKNLRDSFSCNTHLTSVPWKSPTSNQLLFVNLQAPKLVLDSLPPSNFVFLIDASGSMEDPKKLPLLQSAFKLLVQNLRPQDTVAIVAYGGTVGVQLQPTSGGDKKKIIDAINKLTAGGETPGSAGIQTAYTLAERSFNRNANNRIILATDGDFNVGQTSEKELEDLIAQHKQSGIYLTCLGVGMGNYKDSKLVALATKGNGNFAYIDNLEEAQKVLIREFTKTLYAVAQDAFLSIQFNPAMVKDYRLIGFDNNKEAMSDSASELEGGEVGSGHSLMAVFEIVPTDKNLAAATSGAPMNEPIATLRLRYKQIEKKEGRQQNFKAAFNYQDIQGADSCLRFAASVAMFGELLKQSAFANGYTWPDLEKVTASCANMNDAPQKEFFELVEKAAKIYAPEKQKHRR
jgi:Ca-activated chloride channel family protein